MKLKCVCQEFVPADTVRVRPGSLWEEVNDKLLYQLRDMLTCFLYFYLNGKIETYVEMDPKTRLAKPGDGRTWIHGSWDMC